MALKELIPSIYVLPATTLLCVGTMLGLFIGFLFWVWEQGGKR